MTVKKQQITKLAKKYGYKKVRDENGSFYYTISRLLKDKFTSDKIRFSDHDLGENCFGERQMAGATCNIVGWEKDLTIEKLHWIFWCPSLGGEFQIADDISSFIESEGGIEEIQKYFDTWGEPPVFKNN